MAIGNRVEISLPGAPVAAASTNAVSSAVDLSGFDGCLWLATMGAATTGASIQAQLSASTTGGWHNATGAVATFNAANRVAAIDLIQPQQRYSRLVFASSAASDYSGAVALRYGPVASPTTAGSAAIPTVTVAGAT